MKSSSCFCPKTRILASVSLEISINLTLEEYSRKHFLVAFIRLRIHGEYGEFDMKAILCSMRVYIRVTSFFQLTFNSLINMNDPVKHSPNNKCDIKWPPMPL